MLCVAILRRIGHMHAYFINQSLKVINIKKQRKKEKCQKYKVIPINFSFEMDGML